MKLSFVSFSSRKKKNEYFSGFIFIELVKKIKLIERIFCELKREIDANFLSLRNVHYSGVERLSFYTRK